MNTKISFDDAVNAICNADLVEIWDNDTEEHVIADTFTWDDESVDTSDYIVGADGWNDVRIRFGKEVVRDGNTLKPVGHNVTLRLFNKVTA